VGRHAMAHGTDQRNVVALGYDDFGEFLARKLARKRVAFATPIFVADTLVASFAPIHN
jgi:hypothetical protein